METKGFLPPSGFKEWNQRKEGIHFSVRSWPIGERGMCFVSVRNFFLNLVFIFIFMFFIGFMFCFCMTVNTDEKGEWALWFIKEQI